MVEEKRRVAYNGEVLSLAVRYSQLSDDWVVFLHGIGCAKECFDHVFQADLTKRFSILTFDFVGFGDSDKPADFEYTLEQHAGISKKLIEQFNPGTVSLVAHSMGGTIGTLLAPQINNLSCFVNLEGNLSAEDVGIVSRRTAEQSEENFVAHGFDQFLGDLKESNDPAYRAWAEWYAKSSKVAIHRSGSSLFQWSISGKLIDLFNELPKKAFIHGDKTGIAHNQSQFKNVDVFSISKSEHFMMLDNPQEFYKVLFRYLDNSLVTIEQALPSDAEAISELLRITWMATYPNKEAGITEEDIRLRTEGRKGERIEESIKKWRTIIENKGEKGAVFVAKLKGRVVGMGAPGIIDGQHRVGALYVSPQAQGRGIGSRLMQEVMKWHGDREDVYLRVASYNTNAINFYKRFGFINTDNPIVDNGNVYGGTQIPEIEMVRKKM